jgi:eukaryotic-like serine/threonine-protein kinase
MDANLDRSSAIDRLFGELLDVAPNDRAERLAAVRERDASLAHEAELLLHQHAQAVRDRFLEDEPDRPMPAASLEGQTIGPYAIERLIGQGGMGSVWLGERSDGRFERRAAIKFLNIALIGRGGEQRFTREGRILGRLTHPHIAQLLDAGVSEIGQPFLVLEYVDGVPIDCYCNDHGLDVSARVDLFLEVLSAVAFAHTNLIVHRDIKPSNVLVDRDGQVKLLDFGIAKLLDDGDVGVTQLTQAGGAALTPAFAAPEQVSGGAITTATDVYSLGVLLFILLTGTHLAGDEPRSHADVVKALVDVEPPRPTAVAPEQRRGVIRGDLDTIVLKTLKKAPAERYGSVTALADDLGRWRRHEPISARPDTMAYRLGRFARRNRVAVAATVVLLAGLSTGLYVVNRQRAIAETRFRQVRQIAGELLNVEQDINGLTGTTSARERIVRTSLDYLERLARDAGGDLALKEEIAVGYRRVAEVQGVPRRINLGHLDQARASLGKAEALLGELRNARFDPARTLRELIQDVDFESRIDYNLRDLRALTTSIARLEALAAEYEREKEHDDAVLSEVFDSLSASVIELGRLDDAATYARRATDARREVARRDPSTAARGALANSLGSYVRVARNAGRLEDAERAVREELALLEQLTAEEPANYRWRLNLANTAITLGRVLGDADGPSLGRLDEAIAAFERGLAIGREVLASDAKENLARNNHALGAWRLADAIRTRDPVQALALYDEAIAVLRGTPGGNFSRDIPLVNVLAESTLPLRHLHRDREARERLEEAKGLAQPYRKTPSQASLLVDDPISRAEADWAFVARRPHEAVSWHQTFVSALESLESSGADPRNELTSAFVLSRRYGLLVEALVAAGRSAEASAVEAKRRELVQFWKQKLPGSRFVEPVLMR